MTLYESVVSCFWDFMAMGPSLPYAALQVICYSPPFFCVPSLLSIYPNSPTPNPSIDWDTSLHHLLQFRPSTLITLVYQSYSLHGLLPDIVVGYHSSPLITHAQCCCGLSFNPSHH